MSPWSDEFQRAVVSAAVRGDLLSQLPLEAELFAGSERGPQSPRQRIVAAVLKYFADYRARPSAQVFSQLVADAAARLGPEERLAIEREAAVILAADPADAQFVRDRVRTALELRMMERALVAAAEALNAGESGLPAARELIARGARPIEESASRRIEYLADRASRLDMWRRGDEYGERISTGFEELDVALRGGPTRREAFYFLAPPKGAKTAALLHVALAALRRQLGVYVVTYEMQSIRMALRVDRMLARSSKEELEADLTRLERGLDGLRASGAEELHIDERPAQRIGSVADVSQQVVDIRRRGGKVDLVVFDYLNIMGSSKDEDELRHELPRVSREISTMAKELDVLTWSAALVNRKAVGKRVVRKTDIAEAFEVVAVADGMVAICATAAMLRAGLRRFYVAAAREEADEVRAGDYAVDFARMLITPADQGIVDGVDVEDRREET